MKEKRNIFLLIILLFSLFFFINGYFEKSPYISDFKKVEDYQKAMAENELKFGFMLIYSVYCHHCRHFSGNYIKLSELFHNEIFFYALGQNSDYRKLFKITGYPTILFYSNGQYEEINFSRSVDKLSKFIRKYIPYNCTEITYNNIDTVYNEVYQKDDRNFILGYFNKNSKYINSFTSITNNLKNDYIDLCYYCTDYELIKNDKDDKYKKLNINLFKDIEDNQVKAFSRKNGHNSFIFNELESENNYEKFLFNNVINIYEDIQTKDEINILERMKKKNFIFFVYENDDLKKKYIDNIYDLFNITINKSDSLYYYILLNKKSDPNKFEQFQNNKIHLVSNDLSDIEILNDLNDIKNRIIEYNSKNKNLYTMNKTNIDENNIYISDKKNITENNISDTIEEQKANNSNNNNDMNITMFDNVNIADMVEEKDIIINNIKNNSNYTSNNKENFSNKSNSYNRSEEIFESNIVNNNTNINNIKIINLTKNNINENISVNIKKKDLSENSKNNIIYSLIALILFLLIIYFICTQYLCVGFIKTYDSQIIEFNQPNKIEII